MEGRVAEVAGERGQPRVVGGVVAQRVARRELRAARPARVQRVARVRRHVRAVLRHALPHTHTLIARADSSY